jgi:hypothetical protein
MSIEQPGTERRTSRRGFVRRISGASAAVFAGFAASSATAEAAVTYRCCDLARANRCSGCRNGSPNFSCPSGFNVRRWYCCAGRDLVMCGECNKNSTCWGAPPYACSCGSTTDTNSNFCF